MATLAELKQLKAALDARTDLDPEEKRKQQKRLRKQIRKAGGSVRTISEGDDEEDETPTPAAQAQATARPFTSFETEAEPAPTNLQPQLDKDAQKRARRRERRLARKGAPVQQAFAKTHSWQTEVEAYRRWTELVADQLREKGITFYEGKDRLNRLGYAFHLGDAFDRQLTTDLLLEKFKSRWPGQQPEWFFFTLAGDSKMLLVGPVPGY